MIAGYEGERVALSQEMIQIVSHFLGEANKLRRHAFLI